MLNSKINSYLANPLLGLVPYLVYLILHYVTAINEPQDIAIATTIGLGLNLWTRLHFGKSVFSITYYVVAIAFLCTFVTWLFDKHIYNKNLYVIVCEIVIICLFIFIRVNRRYVLAKFLNNKKYVDRIYYTDYVRSISITQYILTAHLFVALFYEALAPQGFTSPTISLVLYTIAPITIIVLLLFVEIFKIQTILTKLKKEEWLPIITENGGVTGKIAKSEAVLLTNKHLHPVVRVALVSDGQLFLQERDVKCVIDPKKIDYPFEKYVLFNNDINKAVQNSIKRMVGYELAGTPKFVLKYTYENEKTKRLILLYYLYVPNIDSIKRTRKMHGKFWTLKQIEKGFEDDIFAENFELEFEYLKNSIEPLKSENEIDIFGNAI